MEDDDEVWVGILQANTEGQANPVFCAGADLKAINSGNAGGARTRSAAASPASSTASASKPIIVAVDGLATAGGFEIVLACRPGRRHDTVGVRARRGEAQPGRRCRWALPSAAGDRAGGRHGGDPDRRADPGRAGLRLGLISRLVEPGEATNEALRLADTDHRGGAARRLGEPPGRPRRPPTTTRPRCKQDDRRGVRRGSCSPRTPRRASKPSSRSACRTGRVADPSTRRWVRARGTW